MNIKMNLEFIVVVEMRMMKTLPKLIKEEILEGSVFRTYLGMKEVKEKMKMLKFVF